MSVHTKDPGATAGVAPSIKSILDFGAMKSRGQKISMITCYDSTSAAIVAASGIDCILVGDSLAMTMHGYDSTLPATADLMALHVAAVRRGVSAAMSSGAASKFIIGDMPFLAHRGSLDSTYDAVRKIMAAGAQAVKIEGIDGSEDVIRHIVQSGVPVMGHLGLTPQSVHQFGGFKLQATSAQAQDILMKQALKVEAAGAFALVLECVPTSLATRVTEVLKIPTIGIGAGAGCSGQVLVFQDLLGLNPGFKPKFVRTYADGFRFFVDALDHYHDDVISGDFPSIKEGYVLQSENAAVASGISEGAPAGASADSGAST